MGLSFLAPAFFAGLLALAIPVLIHLSYRQKATVVDFPSLMFLQKVPFRSMKRQKIRHWLLFLMRCAAIALLVMAFARPFIDQPGVAAAMAASDRDLVVLLDNSYSMSYGDRWQRAQQAARDILEEIGGADRASLVVFSDTARLLVRSTSEAGVLRGALEGTALSSRGTRYAPAIRMAQQLLDDTELPNREVVLISDFQKAGWDPQNEIRLPPGTSFRPIDLSDDQASNLAISDITLQRQYEDGSESIIVAARVTNQGDAQYSGLEVSLELDDRMLEARTLDLAPSSASTVPFAPFPVGDEIVRGTVRAGSDALPADNTFHFVIQPGQALSLVILEPERASSTDSLFLRRALEIGSRPFFRVLTRRTSQLEADDLEDVSAVILNDAPYPSGAAGRALRELVESGGGLIVALGELSDPASWQGDSADGLVPVFGDAIDRNADLGGTVASFDVNHPVFEVFKTPRSGDFTSSTFYRYHDLQVEPSDVILASFDDGAVAISERSVGDGRVLVWGSTLDAYWNNIPQQPVFLPLAHQLAKYAAGYTESPAWYSTAEAVSLTGMGGRRLPDGTLITLAPHTGGSAASHTVGDSNGGLVLEEPGFYDLAWTESSGEMRAIVASNLDRLESDLTPLDADELAAAVRWRGDSESTGETVIATTPEERETRQAFWWYLLIGAVLLLIAETTLSNRLAIARP